MIQVEDAKEKNAALSAQKEDLNGKQIRLHAKLDELTTDNRFILIQLIFLWGYMMMHFFSHIYLARVAKLMTKSFGLCASAWPATRK